MAKALLGKDVLPDDLPYVTGSIGLLGTRPSYELMRDCDTLLTVGSNFPYTQFLPEFGPGPRGPDRPRSGSLDRDALPVRGEPGRRRQSHPARADPAAAAQGGPVLAARTSRSNVARWWEPCERQAHDRRRSGQPDADLPELSQRLPDDAIVAADSGSAANWYARHLRFHGNMRGSLSGTLATMGPAVPYAIGAKFAHPDRPGVAFVGDGAMQMNGLAELITIARYWQQWTDPRL